MSATAARLTLSWIGIRLSGYCNHNPSEVLSQDGAERPDRMEPANVLEGYACDAPHLVRSFEEISSTDVYAHLAHLLPAQPARFVDVGAGTGRDAAWFAAQGHSVLAVEPTDYLRATGVELHPSPRIAWLSDTLPDLEHTLAPCPILRVFSQRTVF